MTKQILAVNIPEINTKTIEVAGRLHQIAKVTEHCWLLTDLATGEAKQFSSPETMWQYIGTIKPVQDLSLPQLPARCPERSRNAHYTKLNHHGFIHLMMTRGRRIPSGEVIVLPSTTTPEVKIAGLLPAVAGLKPGQCEGYLNAHWSPLATDGMVFEHRGHQYCPHCFTAYHKAMDYIKSQKAA